MNTIITQKDLAKATGLNQSTVSLALRNDPRVNEETRIRVIRAARDLGYKKDPMMSALAAYRDGLHKTSHQGTLAWLHDSRLQRLENYKDSVWEHYLAGARKRADEHGYKLEVFELPKNRKEHHRLSDILFHRGIEGVFLPPQYIKDEAPDFDWKHFAVVTFGWSVIKPHFHSISPNHFQNATLLVENFQTLGYRRIAGLIANTTLDWQHLQLWSHGIETTARKGMPNGKAIPTFHLNPKSGSQIASLQRWFLKYRPDALGINLEHIDYITEVLDEMKIQVPEDIALALTFRPSKETRLAGIYENSPFLGEAAADLIVGTLRRREYGTPQVRRMLQIEGVWQAGSSAPKKT